MAQYEPFIIVPPFTACDAAYIVFGQGTAPYTIYPLHSGDTHALSLESIPLQTTAGVFRWTVDFDAGSNLTWVVVDATGQSSYSASRVVQSGNLTCPYVIPSAPTRDSPTDPLPAISFAIGSCRKNVYSPNANTSSNIGAIVGGIVGFLVVVAALMGWFFLRRRRQLRRDQGRSDQDRSLHDMSKLHSSSSLSSPRTRALAHQDDVALTSNTGVQRSGTFNLHTVDFTEPSLDVLRANDRPPDYRHPLVDTAAGSRVPVPSRAEANSTTELV